MPWAYLRLLLGREWHLPPWAVDQAPHDEVLATLRILEIESEARSWHERQRK